MCKICKIWEIYASSAAVQGDETFVEGVDARKRGHEGRDGSVREAPLRCVDCSKHCGHPVHVIEG